MQRTADLTQGNISAQLVALTIPLLIGNVLQQIYNTVDALVIGNFIGNLAFAAVGVAGTVMNLFVFILSGICVGVSVFWAQSFGAGNYERFRQTVFLFSLFGLGITVVMSLVGTLFLTPLLNLIQTPPELMQYTATYLRIIFLGLFAPFLYHMCAGILRSVGDTRTALYILLTSVILHMCLNLIFIPLLGFGIWASALATVISQSCAAIACFFYLKRRYPHLLFSRADMRWSAGLFRRTAYFSATAALHQSSLYIGKMLVQGTVNTLGTPVISAYTATTRIEGFANSIGDSGNAALSVFIGQNIGSENPQRVKQSFHISLKLMSALSITLALIMYLTAPWTVAFMLGGETGLALTSGISYMRVISFFYLFCYLGNCFVGLFRGCGRNFLTVIGTILQISIRVVFSYLLAGSLGLIAVAVATGLGWISIVAFQTLCYRSFHENLMPATSDL